VVFVAMGTPRQEELMSELFDHHPVIYQGLGGSFDLYTGKIKRAPDWFINHNIEGIYRVITNLSFFRFKRVVTDIFFVIKLFLNFYK
jgi:UDP-N-acetyl-D-mannosaminouronate:lipid I N-acetyl-D-mannosaminouronosyltransferase